MKKIKSAKRVSGTTRANGLYSLELKKIILMKFTTLNQED